MRTLSERDTTNDTTNGYDAPTQQGRSGNAPSLPAKSIWKRHRWLVPLAYALVIALVALAMGAFKVFFQPLPTTPGGTSAQVSPAHTAATQPTHPARTVTPAPTATPDTVTVNGVSCVITSDDTAAQTFLLNLLNQHRAAVHARPLTLNPTLAHASEAHSCDMFQHQSLSHMGSDGSSPKDRIDATGVKFTYWAENIGSADGYGLDSGITTIDNAMMAESLTQYDHHYNIVNDANTEVGLGIIYANGQVWLTEDFIG